VRRVAVTGIGIVSPLGNDAAAFFDALAAGRSGVVRLEGPSHERLASPIGAAAQFDGASHFDAARVRMLDRVSQFALYAAAQAVSEAAGVFEVVDPARVGVFVGTGMGGAHATDDGYRTLYAESPGRLKPFSVLLAMERGLVPPTLNLRVPDPECDLDYVAEGARRSDGLTAVLSNSFAFGGTNATLVARRA
jgi:3-oxoacyl-[acyl-carrier-protein] synthase II